VPSGLVPVKGDSGVDQFAGMHMTELMNPGRDLGLRLEFLDGGIPQRPPT